MEGDFPEEMKCPICFDIPKKEIYQCRNGHLVCHLCAVSLHQCPQCRVNYESVKIRSLGVEHLLDLLKFNCVFKSAGCNKKFARKDIHNHTQNCAFGGETLNFCELVGLPCKVLLNTKNTAAAFEHMRTEHKMKICIQSQAIISFKKFDSFENRSKNCFWTPVIFRKDPSAEADKVILVSQFNPSDVSVMFTCLLVRNNKDKKDDVFVKQLIKSLKPKQAKDIVWVVPTVPISHAKAEFTPGFLRLPVSVLKTYTTNGDLVLNCVICEPNDSINDSQTACQLINVTVLRTNIDPATLSQGRSIQSSAASSRWSLNDVLAGDQRALHEWLHDVTL